MNTWRSTLLLLVAVGATFFATACSSEDGSTPDCKEADLSDCTTPPDGGTPVKRDGGGSTD